LEQGFGNSATQRRVAEVIPVSYAAVREAMWEREREAGEVTRGGRRTREVVGGGRGERLMEILY
jgi:hypothetical protein